MLLIVFLTGSYFRFYNLNWEKDFAFHPDEAGNITFPALGISYNDLNPHRFVYGGFTIYLYRFIGEVIALLTSNKEWISDYGKLNLIGHYISAAVSSFSIILIYLVSQAVFGNKKISLLSALFLALTVSLIQAAHFSTTESLLIFWLLLICILSFKVLNNQNYKNYERLGMISGLAVATKTTGASFLLIPAAAHFFISFKELLSYFSYLHNRKIKKIQDKIFNKTSRFWRKQSFLPRFLFFVFIFFFLFSPFSFLDSKSFKESTDYELKVASGKIDVFYTFQFIKTAPYYFYIDNLLWAQGPFLKIFSLLGFVYVLCLAFIKRNKKLFILILWPIVYFYVTGSWHTKFIRYLFLILPFLAIFASKLLVDIQSRSKIAGNILIAATIISTLFYSIAFMSIYAKEDTRISASKWIYDNISSGSKIYTEQYEYPGLPLYLPNRTSVRYNIEPLDIYNEDNNYKIEYYANKLEDGDYIIISTRRAYGTLINLPDKYPVMSKYYKSLFNGSLGYELVKEFSSYPNIFGYEINDDLAEETFQVFDHPKVLIFKNNKSLTVEDYKKLLSQALQ